jgi:hypothetical protein
MSRYLTECSLDDALSRQWAAQRKTVGCLLRLRRLAVARGPSFNQATLSDMAYDCVART